LEELKAVSENFELATMPNQFCIGEMLDWDAPTGGYLLQACA
jgi:predicted flavoprotein YhiN